MTIDRDKRECISTTRNEFSVLIWLIWSISKWILRIFWRKTTIFSSSTRRMHNLSDLTSYFIWYSTSRAVLIHSRDLENKTWTYMTLYARESDRKGSLRVSGWYRNPQYTWGTQQNRVFFRSPHKNVVNVNSSPPPKIGKKEREIKEENRQMSPQILFWLPTRCWLLTYKPEITISLQINHPPLFIFPLSHCC